MKNVELFRNSLIEGVNKSLPLLEEAEISVTVSKKDNYAMLSIMNYLCEDNSFKYDVLKMRKDFSKNFKKISDDTFEVKQGGYKISVTAYDDSSVSVELVKNFQNDDSMNGMEIGEEIGLNYYKFLSYLKQYAV